MVIPAHKNSKIINRTKTYETPKAFSDIAMANLNRNTKQVNLYGELRNVVRPGDMYPGVWGWDAAFHAIGLAHQTGFRGLEELEVSALGQTELGMIPSILFYDEDQANRDYYPGPNVWEFINEKGLHISGISQPPVYGFALERILEKDPSRAQYTDKIKHIYQVAYRYHEWWYEERDPEGNGLVVTIHPWETGRDNAVEWDVAKNNIRQTQAYKDYEFDPSVRLDNKKMDVDPEHRPDDEAYKMFIYLLDVVKTSDYTIKDNQGNYRTDLPFCLQDVTINSFLMSSNESLIQLSDQFGTPEQKKQLEIWHEKTRQSFRDLLWNEEAGCFQSRDTLTGKLTKNTNASYISMASNLPTKEQALSMSAIIDRWEKNHKIKFGIPSTSPEHPSFEPERYWRGPTWSIVNYVVVYGFLKQAKRFQCSKLLDQGTHVLMHTLDLIYQDPDFHEYHNPITGKGCGGKNFGFTSVAFLELETMLEDLKKMVE